MNNPHQVNTIWPSSLPYVSQRQESEATNHRFSNIVDVQSDFQNSTTYSSAPIGLNHHQNYYSPENNILQDGLVPVSPSFTCYESSNSINQPEPKFSYNGWNRYGDFLRRQASFLTSPIVDPHYLSPETLYGGTNNVEEQQQSWNSFRPGVFYAGRNQQEYSHDTITTALPLISPSRLLAPVVDPLKTPIDRSSNNSSSCLSIDQKSIKSIIDKITSNTSNSNNNKMGSKKRNGGRKPREEETQLPPEEEEKRRLRRIRNKEAAARCRKRRMDQMSTLEIKVNELNEQQHAIEDELEQLNREKEHLQFILRAHEPVCRANKLILKNGNDNMDHCTTVTTKAPSSDSLARSPKARPQTLKLVAAAVAGRNNNNNRNSHNPDTTILMSMPSVDSSSSGIGVTPGANLLVVPIQTPSKVVDYDPSNAPTGFTPLSQTSASNFLAPFLANQHGSNCMTSESLETPIVGDSPSLKSLHQNSNNKK